MQRDITRYLNPGNFACDKNAIVELDVFVSASQASDTGRPLSPVTLMLIVREAGLGLAADQRPVLASTGLTGAPGLRQAQRPL